MFLVCKVLDLYFARKMLFKAAEVKGFNFPAVRWLLIFLPFISLNIHSLWSNCMSQFNLWHLQSIYHVCNQAAVLHVLLKEVLGVRWRNFIIWKLIKACVVLGEKFLTCTPQDRSSTLLFCCCQRPWITIFFWYNQEQNTYTNYTRKSSPSCYTLNSPALSSSFTSQINMLVAFYHW